MKSDKGYFVGRYNAKNIGTDSRVSLVERPISLSCKGFRHIGLDIAGFGNAAIVQAQTVGKLLDNPQETAQANHALSSRYMSTTLRLSHLRVQEYDAPLPFLTGHPVRSRQGNLEDRIFAHCLLRQVDQYVSPS